MFHVFEGGEESSDLGKTHTRTESYMETPYRKTQAETVLFFIPRLKHKFYHIIYTTAMLL